MHTHNFPRITRSVLYPVQSILDDGTTVKVERPKERFAMGGMDETSSFENRRHALGRVDKDAKGAPSKPEDEVHQSEPRPHVPGLAAVISITRG
jgi:hypothetical protein